ncbi:MAG: hypothetical protein IH863_04520 [Chloroflexi bacterium]|nr:hypothetical protein [Chloroflexota bacterium]
MPSVTPEPTPTASPLGGAGAGIEFPRTGGSTTGGADQSLLWVLVLALGCLVAGSTFVVLARARR